MLNNLTLKEREKKMKGYPFVRDIIGRCVKSWVQVEAGVTVSLINLLIHIVVLTLTDQTELQFWKRLYSDCCGISLIMCLLEKQALSILGA